MPSKRQRYDSPKNDCADNAEQAPGRLSVDELFVTPAAKLKAKQATCRMWTRLTLFGDVPRSKTNSLGAGHESRVTQSCIDAAVSRCRLRREGGAGRPGG